MTAYNREALIGAAIESVLAQTMADFELVIVDDRFERRHHRRSPAGTRTIRAWKVVQNESNLGDYPNRNHALTLARGEYVKYHDSDDVMYPHCLQVMVEGLDTVPDAAWPSARRADGPGRRARCA